MSSLPLACANMTSRWARGFFLGEREVTLVFAKYHKASPAQHDERHIETVRRSYPVASLAGGITETLS